MENIHDEIERLLVLSGQHRKVTLRKGAPPPQRVERLQIALPGKEPNKSSSGNLIEKLQACGARLRAKELAGILGVSKETVLRRAKRRVYPSYREGNAVYFNSIALVRYFQNKGIR